MSTTDPASSNVLEGRDGFLFLANDISQIIDQIEGRYQLDERQIWLTAMTHAARRRFCATVGATYHHFIVPDRETVLGRFLPDSVVPERCGVRPILQYSSAGAAELHAFHYNRDVLADDGDETCLPRFDTHWTFEGALRYVRFMISVLGFDARLLDLELAGAKETVHMSAGDLGSKVGRAAVPVVNRVPVSSVIQTVYDNQLPNTGRIRVSVNPQQDSSKRLVVLHDSFGNIPRFLLAPYAATAMFIHVADFDEVFVRRFRPSHVVMLQIERFFVRCPSNSVNWIDLVEHQYRLKRAAGRAEGELQPFPEELLLE